MLRKKRSNSQQIWIKNLNDTYVKNVQIRNKFEYNKSIDTKKAVTTPKFANFVINFP